MNADAEVMFMFILGHLFYFILLDCFSNNFWQIYEVFLKYVGEVKNAIADGLFMYVLKIHNLSNSRELICI